MAFLIILMAVGVLFILSEILIVPGTVVSGVLGIAALGASCIYAYIEFGAVTGTAVTVSGVLLAVLMTVSMIRAGLRKRLGFRNVQGSCHIALVYGIADLCMLQLLAGKMVVAQKQPDSKYAAFSRTPPPLLRDCLCGLS